MGQVSAVIKKFFENFESGTNSSDIDLLAARYADVFMFAGPLGAQPVKKEDFIKVLPRRQALVKSLGLVSSTIRSLEETPMTENYTLVKAVWNMRFEKTGAAPINDENFATYILFQDGGKLQIVFQLDHQDLMKKVEQLGLRPSRT